jgi:hypothetical protein
MNDAMLPATRDHTVRTGERGREERGARPRVREGQDLLLRPQVV